MPFCSRKEYFTHLARSCHWRYDTENEELKTCQTCKKSLKLRSYHGHIKFCERVHKKECKESQSPHVTLMLRDFNSFPLPDLLCEFCTFKTPHPHNLRQHLGSQHGIGLPHSCDQCDQRFFQLSFLKNHIRQEHDKIAYVCQDCGKEFKEKRNLNFHQKSVHMNLHRFKCALCHGKFKTKTTIRRHIQIHGTLDIFQCSLCGEKFRINAEAYRHRLKYHDNNGTVVTIDEDALKSLRDKLIIRIEPEVNQYGTRKPRIKKPEPFLGVLSD